MLKVTDVHIKQGKVKVKLVKIDPPGTICHHAAVMDMVNSMKPQTFIEIGTGDGGLAKKLMDKGLSGIGVEQSKEAVAIADANLRQEIVDGRFTLIEADFMHASLTLPPTDLCISLMVMEHLEDDSAFLNKLISLVRPGGHIIVAVPARMDYWSIEDETVGHFRRYERDQLRNLLSGENLADVRVWSIAYPVANLLFHIGNILISKSLEVKKLELSKDKQTATSGIREVPFKTVFPPSFRILLNRFTLYPLIFVQRLFYESNLGIILMACGKRL
ncbi:MAG: class I SAM-dependent methyltransferase [Candidatus Obscuribacterales bacterium]